jgi:hypothetical protein
MAATSINEKKTLFEELQDIMAEAPDLFEALRWEDPNLIRQDDD